MFAGASGAVKESAHVFLRKIAIRVLSQAGEESLCPIRWIDNFAMRNFTNDVIFDDTLPLADGLLEAGLRVPLEQLKPAMEDWFRRKGYLRPGEVLVLEEGELAQHEQTGA